MSKKIIEVESLTYDDIQLIPQYSEVMSRRKETSIETDFTRNFKLLTPFMASPMHTVCGYEMAATMMKLGGVGIVHRFMTVTEQSNIIRKLFLLRAQQDVSNVWGDLTIPRAAAIGVSIEELSRAQQLIEAGANVLLIDVAHGHHKNVKIMLHMLHKAFGHSIDIIAGNVATSEAAKDLCKWGADAIRVGVGGGSLCTTRLETGHGVPNVTSIIDTCEGSSVPVIADGGIRRGGDVAKALALGASSVMLGSLLSGTNESPGPVMETSTGLFKRYQGSASIETKIHADQEVKHIEGVSTIVPYKGGVKYVISDLEDGLRSGMSYTGAHDLVTFHNKSKFTKITNAGITEAKPHLTL